MADLHDWLAAAAQRGARTIVDDAHAEAAKWHPPEKWDDIPHVRDALAAKRRIARALLLLPEVAAALEPFANAVVSPVGGDSTKVHPERDGIEFTYGDLRRAAKALASLSAVASADGAGEAAK